MRPSLFVAFSLLFAGAAQAQDLNVISSVEVKDEGGSVLVTVKGSKPPNFTTFSMADPARFVIDLSEAKFQGVPEDLRVDDSVIRVVKNLSYGSGATAIARVMLAFTSEVEPPDVQTAGTSLLVRVAKPGSAAVAAAKPGAVTGGPESAAAAGADGTAAAARAEADAAARQEALAREQREVEAREQVRLAAEASAKEREAQAKADADARAREAEKVAAEQAAAEEATRAAADARRAEIKSKNAADEGQQQKPREAAPVAAAPAPKASPEELAAKAQAERDARAQATADDSAKQEIEAELAAQQASEARARAAAAPPPAPTPAPVPAPAPAPARVAVTPPGPAPSTPVPPIPTPALAPVAAPVASLSASPSKPAKLQAIGFKQLPGVSRVFVKTSATPRFTITDVGDDVVRLEVENTRATRRNDTRPLDTSFFASAVSMITASRQGTSYVVDIKLRKRVPYQQKVEGDLLAIDFERPPLDAASGQAAGAAAPAGAPAGGPTGEGALENEHGLVVTPDEKVEDAEPAGATEPATEPAPKQ